VAPSDPRFKARVLRYFDWNKLGRMARYRLEPTRENLHGHFSRSLKPVLQVSSGDAVTFKTLDAGWSEFEQPDPFIKPTKFQPIQHPEDNGHSLVGPVLVKDLAPGDVLEIRILKVQPGSWGWSGAGGFPSFVNKALGLDSGEEVTWRWKLDSASQTAVNQHGRKLPLRPFCGVMGMPDDIPGIQSTVPPRFCGGNIDCKELVEGSSLFLPVAVEGGLFSLGDGHGLQGDGEAATLALECPMEEVQVELHVRKDLTLKMPRAVTPIGWLTLGFDEDLDQAMVIALDGMLDLLRELKGLSRKEALAFSSLCVDLRVTQVVNGVKGVHAVLPPEFLDE